MLYKIYNWLNHNTTSFSNYVEISNIEICLLKEFKFLMLNIKKYYYKKTYPTPRYMYQSEGTYLKEKKLYYYYVNMIW